MKPKSTLCALAAVCVLSAPAFAHDKAAHHGMHGKMMHHGGMFEMLDTNHDGVVTKAEADAYFDKIDANHDGKITREENAAYMKGMHKKMAAKAHEMCKKPGSKHCPNAGAPVSGHSSDFSTLNK